MYLEQYKSKLRTAEEIASMVKSGEGVKLGYFNGKPVQLVKALAERHEELRDVLLAGAVTVPPIPEVIQFPDSFTYQDWHWSVLTRRLADYYPNVIYAPLLYHMSTRFVSEKEVDNFRGIKHNWQQVGPMDEHGYFNFGPNSSEALESFLVAEINVIEVNPNMPHCYGGSKDSIHISQIDFIVEAPADQQVFVAPALPEPTEADIKIAKNLIETMRDGDCIQLGIGGMPNAVGQLIAESDLKDIGIHTEMFVDAFIDMIERGIATGLKKNIDKGKAVYTFALGTQRLFDYMHKNPALAMYSVDYTNHPMNIAKIDNFVSINQAVQVDLLTQVNAESDGYKQISGNGGMADFTIGAQWSKNGRSYICLPATYRDKEGNLISRIVPRFKDGTSITVTRHMVDFMVTEYGIKKMRGQNQWVRTENIIELAHPQFRDELIKEAQSAGIWTRTNKQN